MVDSQVCIWPQKPELSTKPENTQLITGQKSWKSAQYYRLDLRKNRYNLFSVHAKMEVLKQKKRKLMVLGPKSAQ